MMLERKWFNDGEVIGMGVDSVDDPFPLDVILTFGCLFSLTTDGRTTEGLRTVPIITCNAATALRLQRSRHAIG